VFTVQIVNTKFIRKMKSVIGDVALFTENERGQVYLRVINSRGEMVHDNWFSTVSEAESCELQMRCPEDENSRPWQDA